MASPPDRDEIVTLHFPLRVPLGAFLFPGALAHIPGVGGPLDYGPVPGLVTIPGSSVRATCASGQRWWGWWSLGSSDEASILYEGRDILLVEKFG